MSKKIIIIGSGPGGYVAAIRGAQMGGDITVIEKNELGGTCLNIGCIPTKALLASAEVLSNIKEAGKYGIRVDNFEPDIKAMMERKNKIVSQLIKGIEFLFNKRKVKRIKAEGKIKSPNEVEITYPDGRSETLTGDNIILATGSQPAKPSIFPFDGEIVFTSNEALNMMELPKSLLIVGAGAIGAEFACFYRELGVEVTIIEMLPQIVPTEDKEIAQILEREFKKKKMKVLINTKIEKMTKDSNQVKIVLSSGEEMRFEKALIAVGRKLNTDNVFNNSLDIKIDKGRILVNEKMETSISGIFAIGDITGGVLLAHKASAEGIAAIENIFGLDSKVNYSVIPGCIFTVPEIGSVGLSEAQAVEAGHKIKVGRFPFRALGKAQAAGHFEGMVKIITDEETEEILGVHIIGKNATDIIAEGALGMQLEATAEDLANTIHAHPTMSEAVMEAAESIYGKAIHSI
jgi:dihydrolipoamide dehydrogenase